MQSDKIKSFMALAGHKFCNSFRDGTDEERKLGARLLLSEVLEYVIAGLGVVPIINGQKIEDPEAVVYTTNGEKQSQLDMLDGLADVAYTMYWNACAFGLKLEEAFDLVCDNNLEKFVKLDGWKGTAGELPRESWHCDHKVGWPESVVKVEVIKLGDSFFAVGKDSSGKVRKPSSYKPVDLRALAI